MTRIHRIVPDVSLCIHPSMIGTCLFPSLLFSLHLTHPLMRVTRRGLILYKMRLRVNDAQL